KVSPDPTGAERSADLLGVERQGGGQPRIRDRQNAIRERHRCQSHFDLQGERLQSDAVRIASRVMIDDLNLRYLEKQWLAGQPAERALRCMRKSSDKTLSILLRHHDETEEGVSDRETWIRDDSDFLLGFYSIIEIAMMIGFVLELPDRFKMKHIRVLNHPAVRRYYEWNYPLDPPRRLRERILF